MNPEDKMEMLKWLSTRNAHIPLSELAFLLGLPMAVHPEDEEAEPQLRVQ